MHVVSCAAPAGVLEPAPFTSMPLGLDDAHGPLSAFWTDDDGYRVRVQSEQGDLWYRIEADAAVEETKDQATRNAMSNFLSNVTSIGRGRVLFPFGSGGRTVYRVWRGNREGAVSRTRILAVRAARSRRLPA